MKTGDLWKRIKGEWWLPGVLMAAVLLLAAGVLLAVGPRSQARVESFNLEGELTTSRPEVQLRFEFSRPMDKQAVQEAFGTEPELEGEFSWSGREMVYTLFERPDPGAYEVTISGSVDSYGRASSPYRGSFRVTAR